MNGRRAKYASAAGLLLAAVAVGCASAAPNTTTADAINAAEKPAPLPTFASIPPAPKDIRAFDDWRAAVAEIKGVGGRINAEAAAEPWTLAATADWADTQRAQAAPPPPMPTSGDTDAFVKAMRARATPPPRAH
jgi:hypothetical protein